MIANIFDTAKNKVGQLELPIHFNEELRLDIISRAVLAMQANKRKPYGAYEEAGKRYSAKLSRRRRNYKTSYGYGISRVPRKILTKRGSRFNWVGALAPGTVGGRRAHPPKSAKILTKKINKKEGQKAIRSAIAATMMTDIIKKRGHKLPDTFPFVMDSSFELLQKTKDVLRILKTLGFEAELKMAEAKNVRAGKGKSRARKYSKRKSLLIVTGKYGKMTKAAQNIPGVDIVDVKTLNIELLAPGTKPGRLTLWTKSAVERLENERLFLT